LKENNNALGRLLKLIITGIALMADGNIKWQRFNNFAFIFMFWWRLF
jgi:hypothetical protein